MGENPKFGVTENGQKNEKNTLKSNFTIEKGDQFQFFNCLAPAPISLSSSAHIQSVVFADVLAMFIPEKAASVYSTVLMAFQLTLA